MNTKYIMITSAMVLGITGILLIFIPNEIVDYFHLGTANILVFPIMGALYFGFAMLNWTAKANLIGGIYSKPVSIANFTHFLIAALALVKFLFRNTGPTYLWIAAIIYATYAILFGYITFFSPVAKK
ncbi:MAG: hypothetical protein EOP53_24525 [Sphingobacteriales bacterium]|nr:MAG: hypothetical protein EOP53_24525 [Sphingobacteriales bacterium]